MIKWVALILVACVLCWGDTTPAVGSHESVDKTTERVPRPIDDSKLIKTQETSDALTLEDKIELDKLLEELGDLSSDQSKTGEKAEKPSSDSSNL